MLEANPIFLGFLHVPDDLGLSGSVSPTIVNGVIPAQYQPPPPPSQTKSRGTDLIVQPLSSPLPNLSSNSRNNSTHFFLGALSTDYYYVIPSCTT